MSRRGCPPPGTSPTSGTGDTFSYNASGNPYAFRFSGAYYYYITNLQGDVVGIVDKTGVQVVAYSYDAWGNLLGISSTKASTIGTNNPLRYRGYVYDTETSLYYLQSRYYNPATGRFINADSYTSTGSLLGNNMFAYCLNNPVNGYDPCGTCFHHWKFWEDCDECKGKTILERINETLEQIAEVNRQQQELQNEITMTQVQMIQDAGQAVVDAYVHSVELEAEAQYQRDMKVIALGEYYKENPKTAVDHALAVVGACGLYCGYMASAGITVPATVITGIKGIEYFGIIWGIYRAIEEIYEEVY